MAKTPKPEAGASKPDKPARGRPAGSENREYANAEAPSVSDAGAPTKCPRCESTNRAQYFARTEQAIEGVHNGQVYNRVIWRRTKCNDCGQYRVDRSFEVVE